MCGRKTYILGHQQKAKLYLHVAVVEPLVGDMFIQSSMNKGKSFLQRD